MLRNYLVIAWRHLFRHRLFSFVNILGLALGLASCLLIIQYAHYELTFDNFHDRGGDIYRVISTDESTGMEIPVTLPFVAPTLAEQYPEIEATVRILPRDGVVLYEGDKSPISFTEENYAYVDAAFFELFSFPVSAASSLDDPYSLLISQAQAQKYFGEGNPIGQTLSIHDDFGKATYTVKGTFANASAGSHLDYDMLLSFDHLEGEVYEKYYLQGWQAFFTYLLLKPQSDPEVLAAKFPALIETVAGPESGQGLKLQPMQDIHLHSDYSFDKAITGNAQQVYFLILLGIFILLLAWLNYVNMATSRAMERAREVGIRKTVGSTRGQLIGQFLMESLLLSSLSLGLALTLIQGSGPWFRSLTGLEGKMPGLWQSLLAHPELTVGLLISFALGALLAGLYPAWLLSGFDPAQVVKGKFARSRKGVKVRQGMVIFQFAIATCLLMGTFVIYGQIRYMQDQDLGVQVKQRLAIAGPAIVADSLRSSLKEVALHRFEQIPGVKEAIATGVVPGRNFLFTTAVWPAEEVKDLAEGMEVAEVPIEFFDHFGIELIVGRTFEGEYESEMGKIILNEAAARSLGYPLNEEILGRQVRVGNRQLPRTIIGLVKNYHHSSLRDPYDPAGFFLSDNANYFSLKLDVPAEDLQSSLESIEMAYLEIFPANPFEAQFLDEIFDQKYQEDKQFWQVFTLFTWLALFIAALGLLGLSSYLTLQRNKEISIRKVLGASVIDILSLLSTEFLKLVIIAICLALPVSMWVAREWLQNFAFTMDLNVSHFLLPALLVLLVAAITVSFQSVRSAQINPAEVLKGE